LSVAAPRIAIVMLTAIGDAVHVLPVANSIRAAAPGARITWILQPAPLELVRGHPAIDEFIVFERARGWRGFRELRRALRGREFDLVLALQTYFKAGVVTAMLRAPRKLGFDAARARDANWLFTTERIRPLPARHVQDQFLEFVDHLGMPRVLEWGLGPTPAEEGRYSDLLPPHAGPTVAFVVGTSRSPKEWPAERYAALADRLRDEVGARCVLVGGRSERESRVAATIAGLARHPPLDLREWDLRRLVYLLDRADVTVSPDTGPLHVAVALRAPVVALMGFTNPKRVGPYGRFADLLIDAYGEPGEDYPATAGYRPGRMQRISVDEVVARVRLALLRYPRDPGKGQAGP
jgi:heptosyltransferase I